MTIASVTIVATGARTPLGLKASAAAAVRAGINRIGEHPFMIDRLGDPMPSVLDPHLDPEMVGPERLIALAQTAIHETCVPLNNAYASPLPVYLALPELRPGFTKEDAASVQAGIASFKGLPIAISEVRLFTEGHAAGLSALAAATEKIRQGTTEACLVGGVDSYFQPDTMEWLDENRQLAGDGSRSGFVPGEGAGFCLIMAQETSQRLGLSALAHVRTVAVGLETKLIKSSDVCLGVGLTATVREAVGPLRHPSERINTVICDMNSERYRGEEWGFVCLRLPEYFDDPAAYLSPAECWGDMGAASAPLFGMLACQAGVRGYVNGSRTLVWTSSEGGLRGAAVLDVGTSAWPVDKGVVHV